VDKDEMKHSQLKNNFKFKNKEYRQVEKGYVPDKCRANGSHVNRTQNSHLKQCVYWELIDLPPHPI
jgi:hypothetical protein